MEAPATTITCMHTHPVDSPYSADDIRKSKAIRLVATFAAGFGFLMTAVAAGAAAQDFNTVKDLNYGMWEESGVGTSEASQKVYFGLQKIAVETPMASDTVGNEVIQSIEYNDCQKPTVLKDGTTEPLIPGLTAEVCHDCSEATDDMEDGIWWGCVFQVLAVPFSIMRMSESMNSSGSKVFLCVWLIIGALGPIGSMMRFEDGCYDKLTEEAADMELGSSYMLLVWVVIFDVIAIILQFFSQSNPLIPATQAIPCSPLCLKKSCCKSAPPAETTSV
jgi:hypothetical protein